jgi:cyclomaltodextrinase / maltogenic alpha-amylase / neopullulanase
MKRRDLLTAGAAGAAAAAAPVVVAAPSGKSYANRFDAAAGDRYTRREADWRCGAVVYQVLVDRFAPSANLDAKRHLYPAPKVLRRWDEPAQRGTFREDVKVWSHEIDFWGGDLASTLSRLDHVQGLGADVLYLNPIVLAYTNHKYDALDYNTISPEYGTRADVKKLATELKRRRMKLVLDGVFNHMGRNSPKFLEAQAKPSSPYRSWFDFNSRYEAGYRGWYNVANLPELQLENPAVRAHVFGAKDSVVRSYLRDGVDGWRLDVGFDIGFRFLEELTRAAHAEKPGSLVVGEIANYPKEWYPSVDGVMLFLFRHILWRLASGRLDGQTALRMLTRSIEEAGTDNMLRSWLHLDNHDTERLATMLPNEAERRLAQVMQFTLPVSPNLYYGSEVDMTGSEDPEQRSPMRWDRVDAQVPSLAWTQQLIAMRKAQRALRVGDYRPVTSHVVVAYERYTERAADTVLVLINPSEREVTETVMPANSKLMDGTPWVDLLPVPAGTEPLQMFSSLITLKMPPKSWRVVRPQTVSAGGYSNYKRVQ